MSEKTRTMSHAKLAGKLAFAAALEFDKAVEG